MWNGGNIQTVLLLKNKDVSGLEKYANNNLNVDVLKVASLMGEDNLQEDLQYELRRTEQDSSICLSLAVFNLRFLNDSKEAQSWLEKAKSKASTTEEILEVASTERWIFEDVRAARRTLRQSERVVKGVILG